MTAYTRSIRHEVHLDLAEAFRGKAAAEQSGATQVQFAAAQAATAEPSEGPKSGWWIIGAAAAGLGIWTLILRAILGAFSG